SSLSFSLPSWRARRAGKHSCAPGGTAGFCFDSAATGFVTLRVYGSSKNQKRRDFWHLLKKQPLASRAGTHSPLGAPPGAGQKRRTNERGNQNSKDRRKRKTNGLMGGALGSGRDTARLHPRGVFALPQLLAWQPAPGVASVPSARTPARTAGHVP